MRILVIIVIAAVVTVLSANIINGIMLKGAQSGGKGISKEHTFSARIDPESHAKKTYPTALGMASIVGLLVFGAGYAFTKPKKK